MNGKPTPAAVVVAILSVVVAALATYIMATTNIDARFAMVEAKFDTKVKVAQAPVLRAVEQLSRDVREVRSILLKGRRQGNL